MPIRFRENGYPGINAHLQNRLLMKDDPSPSAWSAFHAENITNLTNALNEQLPDHYVARTEQSLQIRSWEFDLGIDKIYRPQPDSTIYRQATGSPLATPAGLATPTWEATLEDLIVDRMLPSVIIHRVEDHSLHGEVVTRLELLSPSNKPGGSKYTSYLENRVMALKSGSSLVEIDYFHQTPTPLLALMELPSYPHKDAYPYHIGVNIPQENKIHVQLYGFGVVDPLPSLNIPLAGDEVLPFDFNAVYQYTFRAGRWGTYLDYEQPLAEDTLLTYRQEDHLRLENLRLAIMAG
jgi:hypothetical protein